MTVESAAVRLGAAAGTLAVLLVAAPYAVADPRAIGVYYGGLLGPPMVALFVAIAAIALLGAGRGRTDPPTAAGVVVVFGTLSLGLAVVWAVGVSPALVGGMTQVEAFRHHRWALVAATLGLVVAGGWYAREVI